MKKKSVTIVLVTKFFALFLSMAFGQKETEVVKRYDYSSPAASFASLKKAIEQKDMEGILIHDWQAAQAGEENPASKMTFENYLADAKNYLSKYIGDFFRDANMICSPGSEGNYANITDFNFLKETERHVDEQTGRTICEMVLEHKSEKVQIEIEAVNYKGTPYWWMDFYRGCE